MGTVYKKEIKLLFSGMMGYIYIALIFFIVGIYMRAYNLSGNYYANFEYIFSSVCFIFLIIIPILTMRSVAEETRLKTDQLLFTAPISMYEIVLGKFFAMVTVLAVPVAAFFIYPLILSSYGSVNYLSALIGIIAFFMLGAMLTSVGLYISTLTDSQIISAVICFIVLFVSYFMSGIINLISSSAVAAVIAFTVVVAIFTLIIRVMTKNLSAALTVGLCLEAALVILYFIIPTALKSAFTAVLSAFAAFDKIQDIAYLGLLDLKTFLYYISVTAMFLFFATQSLEKRRWS